MSADRVEKRTLALADVAFNQLGEGRARAVPIKGAHVMRHDHEHEAAGPKHAHPLLKGADCIEDVLDDVTGKDIV
jgi:hypothetical protein